MSRRYYPYDVFDPFFGAPVRRRPRPRVVREGEGEGEHEHVHVRVHEDGAEPDQSSLRAALSELEKAKARVERDAERTADETRVALIEQLFPVLDNLDRSIAAATDSPDENLLAGIELVRDQFAQVLASYGVERIDAVGCDFDPTHHDAVAVVPVDDWRNDGVVVDEWQPGYRMGTRVLRPAKVRVGKLAA